MASQHVCCDPSDRAIPSAVESSTRRQSLHQAVQLGAQPLLLSLALLALVVQGAQVSTAFYFSLTFATIAVLLVLEQLAPFEARSESQLRHVPAYVALAALGLGAAKLGGAINAWLAAQDLLVLELGSGSLFAQVGVGILAAELGFYIYHRAAHTLPWLWRIHLVHHAHEQVNVGGYFYAHPIDALGFAIARVVPLILLGISGEAMFAIATLTQVQKLVAHANIGQAWGVSRYLIGTAEMHRMHHSRDRQELGNYGIVLPLWDQLFGTFVTREDEVPHAYGISGEPDEHRLLPILLRPFRSAPQVELEPSRSTRATPEQLTRRFELMSALSPAELRELARVRETRMQALPPAQAAVERGRFVRSLSAYTWVTRGFDASGTVRYFNAFRIEQLDEPHPHTWILVGPHFREPGYRMRGSQRGTARLMLESFSRRPHQPVVFSSAVSLAGYAVAVRCTRGSTSVHLWGDTDLPVLTRAAFERMQQGLHEGVQWDAKPGLMRFPNGPRFSADDVFGLTSEEVERYLARAPRALGSDTSAVVLASFEARHLGSLLRYLGIECRRILRRRWLGRETFVVPEIPKRPPSS